MSPTKTPAFTIPTVDISSYVADPSSPAAERVIEDVRSACITSGFFQLIGHGVPRELQEAVLNGAKAFFKLPQEEKLKYEKSAVGRGNRGYEVMGKQVLQKGALPDLKEGYYVGHDFEPFSDPNHTYNWFNPPNVWPTSLPSFETTFRQPINEYYAHMFPLSTTILDIMAAGMPYGPAVFDEFKTDPVAVMRLLHYPPQPASSDALQFGVGAHTDFGSITLLLQDMAGGLEVLNHDTDEWVSVTPNPDAYVVNLGDMMQRWTRGEYRSNLHRVRNMGGGDRYSVPFFFDGNMKTKLAPFDGGELDGEILTVEEHMHERFRTTAGY
ncbi:2og-Fe oxygenase family protein [Mytilinidion resinicola]|uniref:2og-Fe oxygenase family protein n=1 Tax=Mytilinidion resinicola TaxID=574789 RepID=A0A6A6Y0W9_9PEZI|nr:2og-Fe oxygenase family protein [Mytilinidion resinicola]KAF2801457.1 2og-Fe oxygenase family protein [Mytilinidion resinicola]